jgi:hypothetical protein
MLSGINLDKNGFIDTLFLRSYRPNSIPPALCKLKNH